MKKNIIFRLFMLFFMVCAVSLSTVCQGASIVMADDEVLENIDVSPNTTGRPSLIYEGTLYYELVNEQYPFGTALELEIRNVISKNSDILRVEAEEENIWYVYIDEDAIGKSAQLVLITNGSDYGLNDEFIVNVNVVRESLWIYSYVSEDDVLLMGDSKELTTELTLSVFNDGTRTYYDSKSANLTYRSSDESVAVVDENGVVTGKSVGETQIYISGTAKFDVDGVEVEKNIEGSAYIVVRGFLSGDVDNNGVVNAADALMTLKHADKLVKLSESEQMAADMNEDKMIDASDALMILKKAAKLI